MDTGTTKGGNRPALIALGCLIGLLVLGSAIALNRPKPAPAVAPANAVYGTLIGYTEVTTKHHVDTIDINDVPSGHYPFNAVATYKEGTRVQILSHDQNDALVIGPDGVQGYTTIDSIRELCGSDCPLQ